ncbi:hypothetical protein J3F83DRAFT_742060 [Trichoderma novae-zelandiae]
MTRISPLFQPRHSLSLMFLLFASLVWTGVTVAAPPDTKPDPSRLKLLHTKMKRAAQLHPEVSLALRHRVIWISTKGKQKASKTATAIHSSYDMSYQTSVCRPMRI